MQDAEKSNVVQIRDYASRRGKGACADRPMAGTSASPRGELCAWPTTSAPYPGGIDDIPI
jgi:hypothetical protein